VLLARILLLSLHKIILLLLRSGLVVISVFVLVIHRLAELIFYTAGRRVVVTSLQRLVELTFTSTLLEHHSFTLGVVLLKRSRDANLVSSVCNTSLL
jgi:hypothetical protein